MADTTPLAPCPFCGGPVQLEEASQTRDRLYGERRWYGVVCRNTTNIGGSCAMEQRPSASKETAIARWNRRASQKQVPASAAEFALQAIVAAGHVSQELVDRALALPGAPQPVVPVGYALVPVEPTDAMVQAAHHLDLSYMPGHEGADRAAIYRAMIAAAPQPVEQEPLTDERVAEMCGEANRGYCIDPEHYFKAFRDAEQVHGITQKGGQHGAE